MSAKNIVIFPFGGNARESLIAILAINTIREEWNVLGFIDDDPSLLTEGCCGIEVIGGREALNNFPDAHVLAVPGSPDNYSMRKDIIESLKIEISRFATICHPSVVVAPDAQIGNNTVVMPNVIISCGVSIGNHCVILPNTVVAHDAIVGDYCCIGSNVSISGRVVIGSSCYIGAGTNMKEKTHIGEGTLIGLGSNVISDIEDRVIAVGNPARVVKRNSL